MDRFAERDTVDSLNLFYDVMLCNRKIKSKTEKEDFEASYFAMCLLLPRESFLNMVNYLGGFDECYKMDNITILSRVFNVEKRLVNVRLKDLSITLEEEQDQKKDLAKSLVKALGNKLLIYKR